MNKKKWKPKFLEKNQFIVNKKVLENYYTKLQYQILTRAKKGIAQLSVQVYQYRNYFEIFSFYLN